ncbi:hypothetical protein BCR37DRAFT_377278 [Protomyces lactucae-debilis]|uniref:Uncharacterized protein n=1 Tax=Protomyces lactucae-debilis TaxID=2754530 RepID=A0A1Y2FNR1_PROLT|nr:uncharacterized protein BCR37DRAFT_377278 [Protomyces lactucae-debilis]ORY85593.1 hypothetical protein BCR37DRAFT_377278 [Protomyces lactucae-debilis]
MNVASSAINSALWVLRGIHDDTRITHSRAGHVCIRHASPFVFYNRFNTTLTLSLLSTTPFPKDRRIFLQKRGFRTGLLGWTVGALLGGTIGKDIEITPAQTVASLAEIPQTSLSSSARTTIEAEVKTYTSSQDKRALSLQETNVCHIPCSSGDGYFRIRITAANGVQQLAATSTFRILSSSLNTASPRGANLYQLPVEFAAYTTVKSAQVSAWGFFYACFPFLKLGSLIPGGGAVSQQMLNTLWRWAGGQAYLEEKREVFKVDETLAKAGEVRDRVDRAIPWSAVGVRRAFDVEEDRKLGRQGYAVRYAAV